MVFLILVVNLLKVPGRCSPRSPLLAVLAESMVDNCLVLVLEAVCPIESMGLSLGSGVATSEVSGMVEDLASLPLAGEAPPAADWMMSRWLSLFQWGSDSVLSAICEHICDLKSSPRVIRLYSVESSANDGRADMIAC